MKHPVLGALVAVACVAVWVAGMYLYAGHDRPELIDHPRVAEVAESSCAVLTRTVSANPVPALADNGLRARVIREQNVEVVALIDRVRALGTELITDDEPTDSWLRDWQLSVDARARYADDLEAGREPSFVVPVVWNTRVPDRMNRVGLDCVVPVGLIELR